MKLLPVPYRFLANEPGPKMLLEFLKLYDTKEVPGPGDNPLILTWAKELGIREYNHDSIPWCGLAMAIVAHRAGKPVPNSPLWALNWANFGAVVSQPMLGDVLTFKRDGGGHVGLYIGEDQTAYHVLGGNQADSISIIRILKGRLYKAVRPPYINQPTNVRKIMMAPSGTPLSSNEA